MASLPTHFSVRAAQVLAATRPTLELAYLCGRSGPFQQVFTESYLSWQLRSLANRIESPEDFRLSMNYMLEARDLCPECEANLPGGNFNNAVLVWIDYVMENGLPADLQDFSPASREPGRRAIDLLKNWLDEVGPQPRKALEHFLWQRAHPGAVDAVEVTANEYPYELKLQRRSRAFWSTNITKLLRDVGGIRKNADDLYTSGRYPSGRR